MTNKEKYKQAFQSLHASEDLSVEVLEMKQDIKDKKNKGFRLRPAAAAAAAALVVFCGSLGAYASNAGGIRDAVKVWFQGKQVNVTVNPETDENFTVTTNPEADEDFTTFKISDEDGNDLVVGGIVTNGEDSQPDADDIQEALAGSVEVDDNGSVWLYYYDRSYDITEYLQDGSCRLALTGEDGGNVYYEITEETADDGNSNYSYSSSTGEPGEGLTEEDYTFLDR